MTILAQIPLALSSDDGLIAASLVTVIPEIYSLLAGLRRGGTGSGDLPTPPRSRAR